LVAKLKGARDRKKAQIGKCGGRHSMLERNPYVVREAKRLARGETSQPALDCGGAQNPGAPQQERNAIRNASSPADAGGLLASN
jgi:hypothetical protein